MNSRQLPISSPDFYKASVRPGFLESQARRAVIARLRQLVKGQLVVREGDNEMVFGNLDADFPEPISITVNSPRFFSDIAFGGAVGAGEAYIQGHWSSSDLSETLRIFLRNREVLEKMDTGLAFISKPIQKLMHFMNKNTRTGSRKNIAAHYDLGNDFYKLWLDKSMMYSCAFFESPHTSLYEASIAKLDRICRKLNLSAGDSVVEIGTGWGGFAIHAASNYGCHVTTTTISQQQHDYAQNAIREAGLEDRITLLFNDYRDLSGTFDKLVSIEMIEAVGHEFHPTFFRKCCELLKPDGEMLLQAITIADQRYEQYKAGVDFIKRYIFPGGCLTSVTDMAQTMTTHTDMRVVHLEDIGPHYATTLGYWNQAFFENLDEVKKLGYSDEFIRMWEYYLCYCESAFAERVIGDVQMHIMRPYAKPSLE
jgi:cyclopropane-fatty-acyl-phospholipid synthase